MELKEDSDKFELPANQYIPLDDDAHQEILAVFFIFGSVLLGALIREQAKSRLGIPYTPFLLVIGLVLGYLSTYLGAVGQSTTLLTNVHPESILIIFVPILVFESAYNTDWFIFKRVLSQIVLLAGPGVVLNFLLVAVVMKVVLGYSDEELDWYSALTFGSIAAATDPVAVVSLLKSLGAPVYFSTIVEGESLFNDGTAILFFKIFLRLSAGYSMTIGESVFSFITLVFGGVLMGFVTYLIITAWLERIYRDSILASAIIVSAPYIVFLAAEESPVPFSGIISVVTLGLLLSSSKETKLKKKIEEDVHTVLSYLQYLAETIIFFVTGCLIGLYLYNAKSSLEQYDWIKLLIFIVFLNLIRAFSMLVLLPLLRLGVYKMSFKEYVVLVYGGLRGSLGLALALIIIVEPIYSDEKLKAGKLILFYMAGTATFSLLVNGTTTSLLVDKIKMIPPNPYVDKVYNNLIKDVKMTTEKLQVKFKAEFPDALCNWELLAKATDTYPKLSSGRQVEKNKGEEMELDFVFGNDHASQNGFEKERKKSFIDENPEILKEARHRLLRMFSGMVWKRFEENLLFTDTAEFIIKAVKECHEKLGRRAKIFSLLRKSMQSPRSLILYSGLSKIPILGRIFRTIINRHLILIYDVTTNFITIADEVVHQSKNIPFNQAALSMVGEEFTKQREKAIKYLNMIESSYINVVQHITTKRFALDILGTQREYVTTKYKQGEILQHEYLKIVDIIDKQMTNLSSIIKIDMEPPTFISILTKFPKFASLDHAQLNQLCQHSKRVNFKEGEYLVQEGEAIPGLYLILYGECDETYKEFTFKRGIGKMISFLNLMATEDGKSLVTCKATTPVQCQLIELEALRDSYKGNKQIEQEFYKEALHTIRFNGSNSFLDLSNISTRSFAQTMSKASFVEIKAGDTVPKNERKGIVLRGTVDASENISFKKWEVIPELVDKPLVAGSDALIAYYNVALDSKKRTSVRVRTESN